MSVDNVAAEAGVSKPTIYRRWPGKAELATAAVRTIQIAEPAVNTGSTEGDLRAALENMQRSLLRPNGMSLIGTVLAEEAHTPELLALFRERLVGPRRRQLKEILERAKARRELRRSVDPETVASLLVGAFYARYLAASEVPGGFAGEIVDLVWTGIARKSALR
jgi:AcrR family transcriptional regulator